MSLSLIPRRLLSFPSLPSMWDDESDWLDASTPFHNGLSISEDDKNVYVEAALPGIDPAQIEVSYQDGYVWIHGENKAEEKDKQRKYYRQQAQSFSYRVAIPGDIDPTAEPEATCKHGVMRVAFAKSPVRQPKKIQVKRLD